MTAGPHFERPTRIRFDQCDPAGIVFHPQYFVMFNRLVEDWVTDALGISYADLLGRRRIGLPTVSQRTEFTAVSRMGDDVVLSLLVERVGRSSLALALVCRGDDGPRATVHTVLVTTSLDTHRPVPLPDDVRVAIQRFLTGTA